jgi:hypothetical protein
MSGKIPQSVILIKSVEKIDNGYICYWERNDGKEFKRFFKSPHELGRMILVMLENMDELEMYEEETKNGS